MFETLVLKTRSDQIARKRRHGQNHNFNGRKSASDGQRNPGNFWYVAWKHYGTSQRRRLCKQNGCAGIARTE